MAVARRTDSRQEPPAAQHLGRRRRSVLSRRVAVAVSACGVVAVKRDGTSGATMRVMLTLGDFAVSGLADRESLSVQYTLPEFIDIIMLGNRGSVGIHLRFTNYHRRCFPIFEYRRIVPGRV